MAVEPAFVQAMVDEVAAQPGALPLFQYALTEAFEARQDHALTPHAYQAIGGLRGALARRADDVYAGLSTGEQAASRQLFLRLVTLGEGVEDTRRRALQSELLALGDAEAMQSAIDAFDRARLLSFDRDPITRGPTVEVAHEAILREWTRLRGWLDESRHDIRQQRLLAAAAAEWQQAAGDKSYLLTGSRLEQSAGWATETKLALTRQERSFLETSMAERERQETDEIERQARELALQKRAANRLRYMVAGLAIFLVAALVLTVLALDARSTAQKQRDKAEREAAVNHSLVLANAAQREFDNGITDLALALALEAVSIEQPPSEAIQTLTSVAYGPGLRAILTGHPHTVRAVAFSPDGQWALSGSCAELSNAQCTDGELILWDLQSKTMLRRFGGRDSVGHTDWVMSIAFVAHNTALSGSKDGTIILWDLETGQPIRSFQGHTAGVNRVVCHPDGQTFLSASDDTTIILWNIAAGESIQHFVGHSAAVNSVAFSPDGQQFASASDDTSIILWDIASSAAVRIITGHTSRVSDLAFMPEASSTLFSTSYDLTIRSWNTQNGQETYQYSLGAKSDCLAITPDSHYVAMCVDFPIRLLDIETYQDPYRLISSPSYKLSVAISPDGGQVMAGAEDGAVYIWNLSIKPEIRRFEADDTRLSNVAVSPDGQRILTATTGGEVIVWDVRQGTEIRRFAHYDGLPAYFSFSPDGQQALVLAGDVFRGANSGWIGLWDIDTGEEVFRLDGHRFYPRSVAFSPDGRQAITSSMSYPCLPTDVVCGEMIQWDLTTGEEIRRFALDERMDVTSIDFSADGTHIITGTNLPVSKAVLWDIATGEPIREYKAEEGIAMFRAVFSPDEKAVLGAEGNGILYLWDIETGALLRRYVGHEDYLTWVDLSPDGRYMISADASGSIILWNFSTGQELRRMKVPADVTTVSFTPDGQTAFSAPYTGTSVIQWEVVDQPLERLLAWVSTHRYVRDFTCEERAQYDIPPLCEMVAP
ncbi:MAG: WD40 repeat domain-containing protein [Anaerolineae bacterium]|nr:WD40 repeat domain-containing protein [Anaerolineae bacterium]